MANSLEEDPGSGPTQPEAERSIWPQQASHNEELDETPIQPAKLFVAEPATLRSEAGRSVNYIRQISDPQQSMMSMKLARLQHRAFSTVTPALSCFKRQGVRDSVMLTTRMMRVRGEPTNGAKDLEASMHASLPESAKCIETTVEARCSNDPPSDSRAVFRNFRSALPRTSKSQRWPLTHPTPPSSLSPCRCRHRRRGPKAGCRRLALGWGTVPGGRMSARGVAAHSRPKSADPKSCEPQLLPAQGPDSEESSPFRLGIWP